MTADPPVTPRSQEHAMQRFQLDGLVVLVTGASSGLGAAVATACSHAGADVVITARRHERLEATSQELPRCTPIACDLSDDVDRRRLISETHRLVGGPDVLVNAAGQIVEVARAEAEATDTLMRTLEVNLVAPYRLAQMVQPHMRARGGGSIINISSISGIVGIRGIPQASYAASKRALSGLTTELAGQWGRYGIRVNTIAAGFFRSEMSTDLYANEESIQWLEQNTPLARQATPDDFVGAVLWLASNAGSYVTGQTIVIDGGWTIR